jgi:hypothetical protein
MKDSHLPKWNPARGHIHNLTSYERNEDSQRKQHLSVTPLSGVNGHLSSATTVPDTFLCVR